MGMEMGTNIGDRKCKISTQLTPLPYLKETDKKIETLKNHKVKLEAYWLMSLLCTGLGVQNVQHSPQPMVVAFGAMGGEVAQFPALPLHLLRTRLTIELTAVYVMNAS
ncbi:hypothetical protein VNO77_12832 [Canavalia gladiata]|uniref:Uncharacterized protein n=1 Tax=Canavalia gladiata TaxID=3824 RepID=A0AAN9LX67_CANGL